MWRGVFRSAHGRVRIGLCAVASILILLAVGKRHRSQSAAVSPLDRRIADLQLDHVRLKDAVEAVRDAADVRMQVDWPDWPAVPIATELGTDAYFSLQLHDATLRDALVAIQSASSSRITFESHGGVVHVSAPVCVRWEPLGSEGVSRHERVDLSARDMTLGQALRALIRTNPRHHNAPAMRFTAEDGFILVSTDEEVGRVLFTEVYNVRDLIEIAEADGRTREQAEEDLTDVLRKIVDSDSWVENGGTASVITMGGLLLVNQTMDDQAHVASFLAEMRKVDRVRAFRRPTTQPIASDVVY